MRPRGAGSDAISNPWYRRVQAPDTDADAWEPITDRARERAHAVVRAGTAGQPDPDLAQRQIHVIRHHDEIGRREAIPVEELPRGAAAVVHEGLWPSDRDRDPSEAPLGDARIGGLGPEVDPGALRQPPGDGEAHVVTRAGIAVPGIPETDDDLLRARRVPAAEQLSHRPPQTPKMGRSPEGAGSLAPEPSCALRIPSG